MSDKTETPATKAQLIAERRVLINALEEIVRYEEEIDGPLAELSTLGLIAQAALDKVGE